MKLFLSIIILLITIDVYTQNNKIKAGVLGIPLSQSGFGAGMGNIGFEILNKVKKHSWQFHLNISGGSFSDDSRRTTRKWITMERTFYINNRNNKQNLFYSIFIENGIRKILPGEIQPLPDSILQKTKSFEISPGVGVGLQFRISNKIGLQFFSGPKIIFAKTSEHYYNSLISKNYTSTFNELKPGFRFMSSFSYQF